MKRLAFYFGLLQLFACKTAPTYTVEEGIPLAVAEQRVQDINQLRYRVHLKIPSQLQNRIQGNTEMEFEWRDSGSPLIIDFRTVQEDVLSVAVNETSVDYLWSNGHIIIPAKHLDTGRNTVTVSYLAGNSSLNRNEEYLYTLFVPDRASYALPCFDQPDLKATYDVTLEVPEGWTAVGNGPLRVESSNTEAGVYRFKNAHPISTYLFSFAAGKFQTESATIEGREMTMYHRESDSSKVARNTKAIFQLHFEALEWLEDYTGIAYPFEKFDFVCIPSFQYGGMEHPGAILYRASSLFLEPSATTVEQLGRASLIAHETAHMWFGDLVTMQWFNDVWMKEVFANFMAAKVVNPSFPEVNHDLRFFLRHYPSAYEVDRTAGTHPIRQDLANLKDAGTLYGNIIYQKAPIVMRQLELILGEDKFRDGLRIYLQNNAYGNATWPDLIDVLDGLSDEDLTQWSQVWVEEGGRPQVQLGAQDSVEDELVLRIDQSDEHGLPKVWNQRIRVTTWPGEDHRVYGQLEVKLANKQTAVAVKVPPKHTLLNGGGLGYGYFQLPAETMDFLLAHVHETEDPVLRASILLSLWEEMLMGRLEPQRMLEMLSMAIRSESDDQLIQRMLSYLESCFWEYHPPDAWKQLASNVEPVLWELAENPRSPKARLSYFRALMSLSLTEGSLARLESILKEETSIENLTIGENDRTRLAYELAIRSSDPSEILAYQRSKISGQDQRDRFDFITPALSPDPAVREGFFKSLRDAENRSHEPWVLAALGYLHHPIRAEHAIQFIEPSLELMEEIQVTGDIFFPARWIDATLGGHQSSEAAQIVSKFLADRPNYPKPLRLKILQAADALHRAEEIVGGTESL